MRREYVEIIRSRVWQARARQLRSGKPVYFRRVRDFVKDLETVKISINRNGGVTDNAFFERFFRTLKQDKIYLKRPDNPSELYPVCKYFIDYYYERRDHSSIGNVPPLKACSRVA
jgi:putative transposase